jgi:predicted dehydrogenase
MDSNNKLRSDLKVGVIGYGSIGKRHVANLLELGISNIILLRTKGSSNEFGLTETSEIESLIEQNCDFYIISNPTAFHGKYLEVLLKSNLNILCEKPLVNSLTELSRIEKLLENYSGFSHVVYNMRYHLCTRCVSDLLKDNEVGQVYSANFFVGQYLPDWRPDVDHLDTYSSSFRLGGGVTLDLIHEIDLAITLLGKPKGEILSIVKRISNLTIDSEDIAEILYQSETNSVISIHLDYLYRGIKRQFNIVGETGNISCDFVKNSVTVSRDDNKIVKHFKFGDFHRNQMYLSLMDEYIQLLLGQKSKMSIPTIKEDLETISTTIKIRKEYSNGK